jgi:cell division protein FtsB
MRAKDWRKGILSAVLLVAVGWFSWLIWGLGGKVEIAVDQARKTEAAYKDLEARRSALQKDLDTLATPRGQDAAIREAFGVAKSGEEVIVVVPPAPATTTPPRTWWQKVLDWF